MKLSREVRKRFQEFGSAGGRARATRMDPAARRRVARWAAIRRWTRARFGAAGFAELGLPGGELVDAGLCALVAESETLESLVVSLAAPRLRREGVPVPSTTFPDADRRLYRVLEQTCGDLAHTRYLAYLRQIVSFADACGTVRLDAGRHAR